MKRLAFLLGIIAMFLSMPNAGAYTSSYFANMSFDRTLSSGAMSIFNPITAPETSNCNATLNFIYGINNTLGLNYNYLLTASINGVVNFTFTTTGTSNQTCTFIATRDVLNGTFKNATISMQSFATNVNLTLEIDASLSCDSNDTFVFFDDSVANPLGSWGYQFYGPGFVSLIPYGSFPLLNTTYSSCESARPASQGPINLNSAGTANVTQFVYPYNSGNGSVFIEAFEPPSYTTGDMALICSNYNTATQTDTFLFNFHSGGIPGFNSSMTLQPFTNYLLHCEWGISNPGSIARDFFPLNFTLNITDVTPNYVCNASDCINQSRTLTCHDTKNLFPDTVSTQSCLPEAEQIFLGFEDSFSTVTARCIPDILCGTNLIIQNMTVGYPDNPRWAISDVLPDLANYNVWFAQMTGEDRSNLTLSGTVQRISQPPMILNNTPYGSQSLKMWYIPPSPPLQPLEFNATTAICGNLSTGYYPFSTLSGINSTFFVQFNFTFPSTLMALDFDVRRCPNPVQQYQQCGLPPLLGIPESCFSFMGNCSLQPRGDYFMSLFDLTTSTTVINWQDNAPNFWERKDFDLDGNIDPTHNYQLQLGLVPIDPFSSQAECVYFDNVMLINKVSPTVCQTSNSCVGADRIIQQVLNGVCITTIQQNDSVCYAQQQSQAVTGNQSIFLPIGSVGNAIINSTTNETVSQAVQASGFGFLLIFLTPIFWLMLLIVGVMAVVAWLTDIMEIAAVSGLVIMIAEALVFQELVWIVVSVIVIAAFIVSWKAVKAVQGG